MQRMSFTIAENMQSRPLVVVGAGTLGRRIALVQASTGEEVRLVDRSKQALQEAKAFIESTLPGIVATRGGQVGEVLYTDDLPSALQSAWLVTEALPEKLDLKQELFAELDRLAPADAILASNSSSYPSSELVGRVSRRERVVNTHYYMPPEVNALEIMSCGYTDPAVIELLLQRLPAYGLVPFHVQRESVGFIYNRIWAAIKREALAVVAEGVSSPQEVDRIFSAVLRAPVGPFQLMDRVGLDVVLDIENHYAAIQPGLPVSPRHLLDEYVRNNWLGVKTGKGFYNYEKS